MIESRSETRRLSSVDAATWLGRVADSVVVAASNRLTGTPLDDSDRNALHTAAGWLDRLGEQLAEPLDLSHIGGSLEFPGTYSFSSDVAGAAIDAIGRGTDRDAEVETLRHLSAAIRDIENDTSRPEATSQLVEVFESIAQAMLSAAGAILRAPSDHAWQKTFAI